MQEDAMQEDAMGGLQNRMPGGRQVVVVVVVRIANGVLQQTPCHRGSLATPLGLSNLQGGKRRNFPSSLSQPPCGRPAPSER